MVFFFFSRQTLVDRLRRSILISGFSERPALPCTTSTRSPGATSLCARTPCRRRTSAGSTYSSSSSSSSSSIPTLILTPASTPSTTSTTTTTTTLGPSTDSLPSCTGPILLLLLLTRTTSTTRRTRRRRTGKEWRMAAATWTASTGRWTWRRPSSGGTSRFACPTTDRKYLSKKKPSHILLHLEPSGGTVPTSVLPFSSLWIPPPSTAWRGALGGDFRRRLRPGEFSRHFRTGQIKDNK